MKKAIIFTILILSLAITGCIKKTAPALENVGEQMTDDKKHKNTETQKQTIEDEDTVSIETDVVKNIEGTDGWQVYEKEDMDVRMKYHKDWYYDRDEKMEKELGYDLCVGFAESADVLGQGSPYPVEFMIVSGDQELHQGLKFSKVVYNTEDVDYILATSDKNKYRDILDKMAESFEFIDETADDRQQTAEDWQIYKNEELGFEVQYPKSNYCPSKMYCNLIEDSERNTIKIVLANNEKEYTMGAELIIGVTNDIKESTAEEYILNQRKEMQGKQPYQVGKKEYKTTLFGYEVYKLENIFDFDKAIDEYYILDNKKIYTIRILHSTPNLDSAIIDRIKKDSMNVIETFKLK